MSYSEALAQAQLELFEPEHDSLQRPRLAHSIPERVYAERWKLYNQRSPGVNHGFTALEWILCPSGQRWPGPVSRRDAVVAASIIQWLGTNCGGGFLRETERIIETAEDVERLLAHVDHQLRMIDWRQEIEGRRVYPLHVYRQPEAKTRRIEVP